MDRASAVHVANGGRLGPVANYHAQNGLPMPYKKLHAHMEALDFEVLWQRVQSSGGYAGVCKDRKWSKLGQSFNPPKTIHSTVSTHFKKTYEDNLLQMEAGIGPGGVEQRIREVVVEISEASRQKKMAVAASASRPTAAKRAAILAVSDDEWDPTLEVVALPGKSPLEPLPEHSIPLSQPITPQKQNRPGRPRNQPLQEPPQFTIGLQPPDAAVVAAGRGTGGRGRGRVGRPPGRGNRGYVMVPVSPTAPAPVEPLGRRARGAAAAAAAATAAAYATGINSETATDFAQPLHSASFSMAVDSVTVTSPVKPSSARSEGEIIRTGSLLRRDPLCVVGCRVEVFLATEQQWSAGIVQSFDDDQGLHRILYDNGALEDEDLLRSRFCLLGIRPAEPQVTTPIFPRLPTVDHDVSTVQPPQPAVVPKVARPRGRPTVAAAAAARAIKEAAAAAADLKSSLADSGQPPLKKQRSIHHNIRVLPPVPSLASSAVSSSSALPPQQPRTLQQLHPEQAVVLPGSHRATLAQQQWQLTREHTTYQGNSMPPHQPRPSQPHMGSLVELQSRLDSQGPPITQRQADELHASICVDLGGFSAEREGVDSLQLRGVPSTQRLPTTDAVASLAVKSLVQTVAETSFQNAAKSIAGDTTLLAASGPAPMTDQIVQVQQTGQSAALTKQCAAPVLDTQHYWLSTGQTQQLPPLLASRDDGALPHAIKQPKAAPSALSLLHRCQTATASSAPLPQVTTEGHLACLPNQRPAFVPYGLDPVGDCSKQDLLVYKTDTHAVILAKGHAEVEYQIYINVPHTRPDDLRLKAFPEGRLSIEAERLPAVEPWPPVDDWGPLFLEVELPTEVDPGSAYAVADLQGHMFVSIKRTSRCIGIPVTLQAAATPAAAALGSDGDATTHAGDLQLPSFATAASGSNVDPQQKQSLAKMRPATTTANAAVYQPHSVPSMMTNNPEGRSATCEPEAVPVYQNQETASADTEHATLLQGSAAIESTMEETVPLTVAVARSALAAAQCVTASLDCPAAPSTEGANYRSAPLGAAAAALYAAVAAEDTNNAPSTEKLSSMSPVSCLISGPSLTINTPSCDNSSCLPHTQQTTISPAIPTATQLASCQAGQRPPQEIMFGVGGYQGLSLYKTPQVATPTSPILV